MEIENTFIEGLKLIHLNRHTDKRGSFLKTFNFDFFKENGLVTDFKESYFSVSQKDVLRGMHFQIPPFEHTKLVYINQGAVTDVVLDIRKNSKTYGQHFSIEITEQNPVAIYIPVGCAHGYLSKQNNTIVSYLQTSVYNNQCDKGIKWNSFGMNWNSNNQIITERDLSFLPFDKFKGTFL